MDRGRTLESLVRLDRPLDAVLGEVSNLAWDTDKPLAELRPEHVTAVLDRFLRGELSARDVERWADAIECREDIEFERGAEEALKAAIFELATPELEGPLSRETAIRLVDSLAGSRDRS